jgi:hypothetical protein
LNLHLLNEESGLLQEGGARGLPLLGTFEDPRQAYQMSEKLLRLVDPRQQGGIGEFLPGFSYELAQERNDPLGQGLSLLDLIPGGGLVAKQPIKAAIKKAEKGIAGLPSGKESIQKEINELAKTPNKEFTSPTLRGLLESAPRNLKGQALIDWTRANANKGIKPKEVQVLDLENYIKANPDQKVKDVVQGVSNKQIRVSKEIYGDRGAPEIDFELDTPEFDPLNGSRLYDPQLEDIRYGIERGDSNTTQEVIDAFNKSNPKAGATTIKDVDEFLISKNETLDDFLGNFAKARYFDNPDEMLTPKSVGEFQTDIPDKTFAFGNDEAGYELFIDGQRVTDPGNIAYSQAEAKIQLTNKLQEGGDPLRQVGDEDFVFGGTQYKQYVDETLPGGSNYREVVFRLDNVADGQFPKHNVTSHFSEEDAISHALIRDRKLADGTDTLHIDELQSDLHTRGSRRGYASDENVANLNKKIAAKEEQIQAEVDQIKPKIEKFMESYEPPLNAAGTPYVVGSAIRARDATPSGVKKTVQENIDRFYNNMKNTRGEARLSHLNDFLDFVQNNMRIGVENFDAISGLYDILKRANETGRQLIDLAPNYPFKDDWYVMSIKQLLVDAVKEGKSAISVSGSAPIKARYTDDYSTFYETLYDQKIPSAMKKLANRYDGKFVKGKIDVDDTFGEGASRFTEGEIFADNPRNELVKSNIIRITPEMREKILKEGLETFGTGGPVGKDTLPHEKKGPSMNAVINRVRQNIRPDQINIFDVE